MGMSYPHAVRATVTKQRMFGDWELRIFDSAGSELWLWVIPPFSDFYNKSERLAAGLDHVGPRLNGVGVGYRGSAAWTGNASEGWSAALGSPQ